MVTDLQFLTQLLETEQLQKAYLLYHGNFIRLK